MALGAPGTAGMVMTRGSYADDDVTCLPGEVRVALGAGHVA